MWLFFSETNFYQKSYTEALLATKEALKLTVMLPDHKLSIYFFEHQGTLNKALGNYYGAIKSF